MNWYKNKACATIATRKTFRNSAILENINSNKKMRQWKNLLARSRGKENREEKKKLARGLSRLSFRWSCFNIVNRALHGNVCYTFFFKLKNSIQLNN